MNAHSKEENEPLPLVEISSADGEVSLNQKNFTELLSSIQKVPLSVVNVAGPPQNGKSLLFAYLIRYFLAAENDDLEWMDWDNPKREATELKWPREGVSPNTPGIWSYHRPFVLNVEDGSKTAVLLLYTQSSDANFWDSERDETNQLMGLTMILSSNIIFNIHKNIDEECISAVATYIKYAVKCGTNTSHAKRGKPTQAPLQNACFLVRDWMNPSEHAYGMTGGQNYVKLAKLKESTRHIRAARESRQLITGGFQNISGCLLPFPGSNVLSKDFKGSISEMPKEFVKTMADFISNSINIDDMVLKKDSSGNVVTGKLLRDIVEGYLDAAKQLDSNTLNTSKILKQVGAKVASSPADQKQHIKTAMKTYADIWKKHEKKGKLLDGNALDKVQKKARQEAIKSLEREVTQAEDVDDDDSDGDGNAPTLDARVKKQLISKILERFEVIKKEQSQKKAELMEQCVAEIVQQYRDWIDECYPEGSNVKSDKRFLRDSKNFRATLDSEFMEKAGITEDADEMNDDELAEVENLKNALEKEESLAHDNLFGRRGAGSTSLADKPAPKANNLRKSTSALLKSGTDDHRYTSTKEEFRRSPMRRVPKGDTESDDDNINQKVDRYAKREVNSDSELGLQDLDVRKDRQTRASPKPTTSKSLLVGSRPYVNRSNLSISSRASDASNDEPTAKPKRGERVEKSSRESKAQAKREEEKLKRDTNQLVEKLTEEYISKLDEALNEGDVDIDTIHKTHMKKILEKYADEAPYPEDRSEHNLYKEILCEDLKSKLTSAKAKLKRIQRKKQDTDQDAGKLAVGNYKKTMDAFMEGGESVSKKELKAASKEARKEELEQLTKTIGDGSVDVLENAKEEMEKILERFQRKVANEQTQSRVTSSSMLNGTKQEYTKRMAALSPDDTKELEQEHQQVVNELLSDFRKRSTSKETVTEDVATLKTWFQEAMKESKKKLGLKQEHAAGAVKVAVRMARDFYCQEMENCLEDEDISSMEDLVKLHNSISTKAKKKYAEAKEDEVESMLEIAFKKYKDEISMQSNDEPAIGIDLGTTYSCAAIYQKGKVVILPNAVGKYTTPSYVSFQSSGKEIVGDLAKIRAYENPEGTIFDAKRILGRSYDDPKLQEDMKLWPFNVVDGGRGIPMIEVNGKKLNPEIISSKILKQLKQDAEGHLKRKITKAVITVPAYFTDGQKQATIDAGQLAGLEVLSILTEPVAAAMAYKLQYATGEKGDGNRYILVFDLGGGTFDVAVLKATKGKLDVLTVDGDTHLGGEDFDRNLMNYCAEEFKKTHNVDLFDGKDSKTKKTRDDSRRRLKRVQAVCEMQKIALTTSRSADVSVENIYNGKDLEVTVTRAAFEKINEPLFAKTIEVVKNSLKAAKLDKSQITDVVLVGGSTRIPKVQQLLQDYFPGQQLDKKINPDEAVAHGAGLMAAMKQGNVGKTERAYTKIQEVTPMSIGVEIYGGGFSVIIPKSTKIPVKLQERYKTAHNNQTSVQITIYEGEDTVAVRNKHLGDFYLNGIPHKDAGVENIDVEMVINDQGILHVTATCSSTGTKKKVTVTENKQRMGKKAIQRYLAET